MGTKWVIGGVALAMTVAGGTTGCDEDRRSVDPGRLTVAEEAPLHGTMRPRNAIGTTLGDPEPQLAGRPPADDEWLAGEEPGLGMGPPPPEEREPATTLADVRLGEATSISGEGTVREIADRIRREVRSRGLSVVRSQLVYADAQEPSRVPLDVAGKPGPGPQAQVRGELIAFEDPAHDGLPPLRLLVYDSGEEVLVLFPSSGRELRAIAEAAALEPR